MYTKNTTKGFALLIVILFFLAISTAVVFGVATPAVKQYRIVKTTLQSRESYYLAEAVTEDVVYRLRNGVTVSDSTTLTLNNHSAVAIITDTANGKRVTSEADRAGVIRKVESDLVVGNGAAFNYGIQAGNGGFLLEGGSDIYGNVYANGNITGDGGVVITGSAVAANSAPLFTAVSNDSPTTPLYDIIFGKENSQQDVAQSFTLSEDGAVTKVGLYIKRTANSPANATISVRSDVGGVPGTTALAQTTLNASQVGQTYQWYEPAFSAPVVLDADETYWLVIDASRNNSKYYTIAGNTTYDDGEAKMYNTSSGWVDTFPVGLDVYFKIFTGGVSATISGDGYDYIQIGGDAWAENVEDSLVEGELFCENTTNVIDDGYDAIICDSSRGIPPEQDLPVSEGMIADWKNQAEAGGVHSGNYAVGWAGGTTGPMKVTGNVTVNGGGTLTLTGNMWVEGNLIVSGGGKVSLHSSYGTDSGVIVVDGYIQISGNGQFSGSGQPGSYPLLISTGTCPADTSCVGGNSISITGGSGAVVLYAPYGKLQMNGGTSARSLVAQTIHVTGGGSVEYESGLADLSFSSGPSGGFTITKWKEIE